MNGKLLELKIIKKTTAMRNQAKNDGHTYKRFTGKYYDDGNPINDYAGEFNKVTFDNYTITDIDFIDEHTNENYKCSILKDDFLPIENSTIKVYVNDEKQILGYVPYKNAEPILLNNTLPKISMFDLGDFVSLSLHLSIPILSLITIFQPKKFPLYEYADGHLKDRDGLKTILFLILIAFHLYFTYYWYMGGAKVFLLSILGYISGGVLISSVISINRVLNCIKIKKYASKIKKQLKGA